MPASETIQLRLSPDQLADIDRVSGTTPRGTWIKDLCQAAVGAIDTAELEPGTALWLRMRAMPREGVQREGVHHFPPDD